MEQTSFLDRVSSYPGRKKIKILSQTADTIVADVELADEPSVEGTPINATVMSRFQQGIVDANTKSDSAVATGYICGHKIRQCSNHC